ncbi:MAG: hypothetical protein D6736_06425 [Nitrospinota bacterium]|nr:MAG: hypothetical protein D6736_06425 [Nitrospinota bacterium]
MKNRHFFPFQEKVGSSNEAEGRRYGATVMADASKKLLAVGFMWLLMHIGADRVVWAQPFPAFPGEDRQADSPLTLFPIGSRWLELTGELEMEVTHDTHLNLGTTPDDEQTTLTPQLTLNARITPSEQVQGFLQLEFSHDLILEAASGESTDTTRPALKLKETFVRFEKLFSSHWSLQIGRQSFEDPRQWLFDDQLDALRLTYQSSRIQFDLAIARQGLFMTDLIQGRRESSADYYWLSGQYKLREETTLAAYSLIHHESDLYLSFLGLQSQGKLGSNLSYWFDLAHVRGKEEGRTVRGWGGDVGFLYTLDRPWHPFLTTGLAFGSGDGTPEDARDTAFRQTGLHGNTATLDDVDFQYYGELFDPELSNLLIFTAGTGLRPFPPTSLTLMYHHYQQHRAADTLREARITAEPAGRSRNLGHELDFIGSWGWGRFELTVIVGTFWPGSAFEGTVPLAVFAQGRIRIAFE